MSFSDLLLIEPLLKALETEGYTQPTPIQEQAIPVVLQGRDLLGCAQTGTGKTAAFSLPILQQLYADRAKNQSGPRPIRTLILTPTRELAIQIGESINAYGRNTGLRHTVIFGGVGQEPQVQALKRGVEILVATPGRLLDLMNQGYVSLRDLKIFVLDEADRMLDMGFIHDVKKVIAKLPAKRQTLFFSATMPDEIADLANSILTDPIRVEVTPVSSTAEKVGQSVYFTEKKDKKQLLIHLLRKPEVKSALVFTRTKHGANRVAGDLSKAGIKAEAIHGNKSQTARQNALQNFKNGKIKALVATDIAARGIDIDELSHVVNYELPNIPETYVHRIGRTGRAGASGLAWSLCEAEELPYLKDIQKLIGMIVPVAEENPYAANLVAPGLPSAKPVKKGKTNQTPPPAVAPREDIIPLPNRRPDQQEKPKHHKNGDRRPDQQQGKGQQQNNGGRRQDQHSQSQQQRSERQYPDKPANPQSRPEFKPANNGNNTRIEAERSGNGQQNGQHGKNHRPNKHRPNPGLPPKPQPVPPKSRQEKQQSADSVKDFMKNRFSSILEVSSLEKQDFRPKPKPRHEREEKFHDRPKKKR